MELIYDNINNYTDDDYKNFIKLIHKEKANKISKLINNDDKKRSILGEILLIKLLKNKNINYSSIKIIKNKYGKPYIHNINIYFNISHSNNLVICGISDKEIGIDIEKIKNVKPNIINQFTTENEKKYIEEKKELFNKRSLEIYTLKEAYFKCIGTNLNKIKQIDFIIKDKKIICSQKKFNFNLIYKLNNYIIATCTKKK